MSKIVYYVAVSLDGYIAGPEDDISQFLAGGAGIEKYLVDLPEFKRVFMGRRTYEFGYQFGLLPGKPAYPHMEHHIFSDSLQIAELEPSVHIEARSVRRVQEIKDKAETDVYLCGGVTFAGWLLENGLIDQLKIKLNPIVLGDGIAIFGSAKADTKLRLLQAESFDDGLQILTYKLIQ